MTNDTFSGWDSFGQKVPANRLAKAYEFVKEVNPELGTEKAFELVGRAAVAVEKDRVFEILGATVEEIYSNIDLTGRYRLIAHLTTD